MKDNTIVEFVKKVFFLSSEEFFGEILDETKRIILNNNFPRDVMRDLMKKAIIKIQREQNRDMDCIRSWIDSGEVNFPEFNLRNLLLKVTNRITSVRWDTPKDFITRGFPFYFEEERRPCQFFSMNNEGVVAEYHNFFGLNQLIKVFRINRIWHFKIPLYCRYVKWGNDPYDMAKFHHLIFNAGLGCLAVDLTGNLVFPVALDINPSSRQDIVCTSERQEVQNSQNQDHRFSEPRSHIYSSTIDFFFRGLLY